MSKHRYDKILVDNERNWVSPPLIDIDIKTPRRNERYNHFVEANKTMKIHNNKRPRQRGKRR